MQTRIKQTIIPLRRTLLRIEDVLLVVVLLAMILLASSQILLRNLFDSGLLWSDPLLKVMVLWLSLLGAMVAARDHNHISIDVLSMFLPQHLHRLGHILTDAFTVTICLLIAYHGARFVALDMADGVMLFAGFPAWIAELIIPFGFFVIALRYGLSLIYHLLHRGVAAG